MLKGVRPSECSYCWTIEDTAGDAERGQLTSDRIIKSSEPWALDFISESATRPSSDNVMPSYVEVSFSNICNFRCSYCAPHSSSRWHSEILEHGPYPTSGRYGALEYLESQGRLPVPGKKEAEYLDAWRKWWPDLYPNLQMLRITGGEPLLSPETFRILDHIIESPRPDLELGVNTNLCAPDPIMSKFMSKAELISGQGRVKLLTIFTSIDTWGEQAEYIRDGLDHKQFARNLEALLQRCPNARVVIMCTFNAMSPFRFKELLEYLYGLKLAHMPTSQNRLNPIILDTSILHYPEHQSVKILNGEANHLIEECYEFVKARHCSATTNWAPGFSTMEIEKIRRLLAFMREPVDPKWLRTKRSDFFKFVAEHDRRRGTSFSETFPELTSEQRDQIPEAVTTGTLVPLLPYGRVENVLFRAQVGQAQHEIGTDEIKAHLARIKNLNAEPAVFPSHFFESERDLFALSLLKTFNLDGMIQISPGAELSTHAPFLFSFTPSGLGLEIVFDRPIPDTDWSQITRLIEHGYRVRYLFCPTRLFDSFAILRTLSPEVQIHTLLYFAPKQSSQDEFLNTKEIFLLLSRLEEEGVRINIATHLKDAERVSEENFSTREFRRAPTIERYLRDRVSRSSHRVLNAFLWSYAALVWIIRTGVALTGLVRANLWRLRRPLHLWREHSWQLRRPIYFVRQHAWRLVSPWHFFKGNAWQVRKPVDFIRQNAWQLRRPLYFIRQNAWQLRRPLHFSRQNAWQLRRPFYFAQQHLWKAAIPFYFIRRHAWKLRRPIDFARSNYWRTGALAVRMREFVVRWAFRIYWAVYPFVTSPLWHLRYRLPVLYWLLFFPFQKAYWFTSYQWNKRVLNRLVSPE